MAVSIDVRNLTGAVTNTIELPAQIFDVEVNPEVLTVALRVYQANQRQATSKVKTRGEVNRTTHKVWKQKGTGRARHGSKAAPIFVGGGVAHGPTGDQNYDLKLTKRMRQLALKGALTNAFKSGAIVVVEGLDALERSTKALQGAVKALNGDSPRTVIMLESPLANVVSAGRNIENLTITQAKRTNVFEVLSAQKIIVHKPAIEALAASFATTAQKKTAKKE